MTLGEYTKSLSNNNKNQKTQKFNYQNLIVVISGEMMEAKLLSSLDPARFMKNSGWDFKKTWSGNIDISVWLRANFNRGGRLYLFIEYKDQEGKYSIPVDRCMTPTPDSILLNGRVKLTGKGEVEALRVTLKFDKCDASSIVLEDITLKTPGAKASLSKMSEEV